MSIHSVVCIKSVVRAAPDGVGRRTPDNCELNPFDRPALEAALQLKAGQGGTVTVLTMGPPVGAEALAEALAMGADRALLISDAALAGSDTLVTARVLAAAIAAIAPWDLLLFGTRSSDSDTGQVGPQTAAVLQRPFVGGVNRIERREQGWEIQRLMDDWEEVWQAAAPVVLTIHPMAFKPRAISLPGIADAYARPAVECWGLDRLALAPDQVGLNGSPTRVTRLQKVVRDRTCRMLEGEPPQQVAALIDHLERMGVMGS